MYFSFKVSSVFITALSTIVVPALGQCSPTNQSTTCLCMPGRAKTTFPDKCQITQVFDFLSQGNFTGFLARVAPNVNWTLMGTHPLAGEYHNRTIFAVDALQRLANTLDPSQGSALNLVHIVGGGNEEWSVQELHGLGVCKNG
jgi:hypothetical protein